MIAVVVIAVVVIEVVMNVDMSVAVLKAPS